MVGTTAIGMERTLDKLSCHQPFNRRCDHQLPDTKRAKDHSQLLTQQPTETTRSNAFLPLYAVPSYPGILIAPLWMLIQWTRMSKSGDISMQVSLFSSVVQCNLVPIMRRWWHVTDTIRNGAAKKSWCACLDPGRCSHTTISTKSFAPPCLLRCFATTV